MNLEPVAPVAQPPVVVEPVPPSPGPVIGLPNPASVYCTTHGGQNQTKKDDAGNEYGVCLFPDGTSCPDWEYLAGECMPGGTVVVPIRSNPSNRRSLRPRRVP